MLPRSTTTWRFEPDLPLSVGFLPVSCPRGGQGCSCHGGSGKDHTPAGDGGGDDLYSFLIELPEGLFVVDTGDSARNSLKNYLARTNPFFQYAVQIKVAPEEEIGLRLVAMVPARRSTELCENALGCA